MKNVVTTDMDDQIKPTQTIRFKIPKYAFLQVQACASKVNLTVEDFAAMLCYKAPELVKKLDEIEAAGQRAYEKAREVRDENCKILDEIRERRRALAKEQEDIKIKRHMMELERTSVNKRINLLNKTEQRHA